MTRFTTNQHTRHFISGGPGSGKTHLGLSLIADFLENRTKNVRVGLAMFNGQFGNRELRRQLTDILEQRGIAYDVDGRHEIFMPATPSKPGFKVALLTSPDELRGLDTNAMFIDNFAWYGEDLFDYKGELLEVAQEWRDNAILSLRDPDSLMVVAHPRSELPDSRPITTVRTQLQDNPYHSGT
jgi:hypothetical protein